MHIEGLTEIAHKYMGNMLADDFQAISAKIARVMKGRGDLHIYIGIEATCRTCGEKHSYSLIWPGWPVEGALTIEYLPALLLNFKRTSCRH